MRWPCPTPAASVRTVELRITASPPTASLLLDDVPLPGNPFVGHFPRQDVAHRLRVESPGFVSQTRFLTFLDDQSLALSLVAEAPSTSSASAPAHLAPTARLAPLTPPPPRPAPASTSAAPPAAPAPDELPPPTPRTPPKREIDKDDPWN